MYTFYQPPYLSKYSPKLLSGGSLHTFVEKGISEDEKKLFQLLSKKAAVLTLFRKDLFGDAHGLGGGGGRPPLPKVYQTYPTIMKLETPISYLKKVHKMYKSHDTPLEFC